MPITVFLEQIAYSVGGGWIHTRVDCCPRRLFAIVDPYFAQPPVPSCVQLGTDAWVPMSEVYAITFFTALTALPLLVSLSIYLGVMRRFNLRGLSQGLLVGMVGFAFAYVGLWLDRCPCLLVWLCCCRRRGRTTLTGTLRHSQHNQGRISVLVRPSTVPLLSSSPTLGLLTGINNYFARERRGTDSIADNDLPT
jgi:hypothetical protein